MTSILAGAFGFLASLAAHDLAAQALRDRPLFPFLGTCPQCGTTRKWTAWRCPECSRRVSRELLVAVIGTTGAIGFFNTIGANWALAAYFAFLVLSLALAMTDIDAMRIVDRLNLRGTLVVGVLLGIASLADASLAAFGRALLGGVAYFAGTNLMFVAVRGRGFGYGDVKLSIQLGLFTAFVSWGTLGWAVFLTALLGGLISIVVIAVGALTRRRRIATSTEEDAGTVRDIMQAEVPYGPAMIAGSWIAIILAGAGVFPIPS